MASKSAPPRASRPGPAPVRRPDWRVPAGGAVIAAAAIAAYAGTFSVPLLLDDTPSIARNLSIRHLATAVLAPGGTAVAGRPILNLSLAVNFLVSGTQVWSYHAANLAIHVLAGLTLFGIIRRTLAGRANPAALPLSLCAALLWTLHPLQTESVTYLSQRAESLMGLFYLQTLYLFIRGAAADGPGRSLWHALSIAACFLGMGTKEVMVSAPVIVLLYDRTFLAGSIREAFRRRPRVYAGLAASWIPLGLLVASTGGNRGGNTIGFGARVHWWDYALTQFPAIWRYVRLSLWPRPLVFEYGASWVARPLAVLPEAIGLGLLAGATLWALWRRPALGFLGCWFFAVLAPTSLVPGVSQMIVEHRMYLPLASVAVLVALAAHRLLGRWALPFCLVLCAGLLAATVRRNEDYRSELAIWSDTVAKRPDNERAHNNLGLALARTPGRLNDAVAQFEEALRLRPDYADAHNNLGLALARTPGRLEDAVAQYEEALSLEPDFAEAHNNLGNAWSRIPGRQDDAVAQYAEAVRLRPDSAEMHNNLGLALSQEPGRQDAAIAQYEEALRIRPDYADAHTNLGVALSQIPGRLDDAIAQYEEAVRLRPDGADAHYNLGCALERKPGGLGDAVAQYREALRLEPDLAQGWHNLGASLYHMGNLPAAAAAFREELRCSPDDAAAQQALETVLQKSEQH
jgi:tetratricopeptide (TPR) repeat protein